MGISLMETFKQNDEIIAEKVLQENEILAEKIMATLACCRQDATRALREVLRFLFLVSRSDTGRLTPSHRVDLAWHEFILCTKAYREVCDEHFGRYIDHHPGGSRQRNRRQYKDTLIRYLNAFGSPDRDFWSEYDLDANCGACESI